MICSNHLNTATGGIEDCLHRNERRTWQVIALTLSMMIVEISAGTIFGSMALLADGWHMGTHAAALGITALAYVLSRRNAANPLFSFGPGKIGVLGGYTSAIVLALVAFLMTAESVNRLLHPRAIQFGESIIVAVVGLTVNVLSAWILQDSHHAHDHAGPHTHHHHDHNLKAAYLHVMADALTSVLAIVALLAGKYFGWAWLDPAIGIVGAGVILRWAYGLLKDTSRILLDRDIALEELTALRHALQADPADMVSDLHVWKISPQHKAVMATIESSTPKNPEHYRDLLTSVAELSHITIEVNHRSKGT